MTYDSEFWTRSVGIGSATFRKNARISSRNGTTAQAFGSCGYQRVRRLEDAGINHRDKSG